MSRRNRRRRDADAEDEDGPTAPSQASFTDYAFVVRLLSLRSEDEILSHLSASLLLPNYPTNLRVRILLDLFTQAIVFAVERSFTPIETCHFLSVLRRGLNLASGVSEGESPDTDDVLQRAYRDSKNDPLTKSLAAIANTEAHLAALAAEAEAAAAAALEVPSEPEEGLTPRSRARRRNRRGGDSTSSSRRGTSRRRRSDKTETPRHRSNADASSPSSSSAQDSVADDPSDPIEERDLSLPSGVDVTLASSLLRNMISAFSTPPPLLPTNTSEEDDESPSPGPVFGKISPSGSPYSLELTNLPVAEVEDELSGSMVSSRSGRGSGSGRHSGRNRAGGGGSSNSNSRHRKRSGRQGRDRDRSGRSGRRSGRRNRGGKRIKESNPSDTDSSTEGGGGEEEETIKLLEAIFRPEVSISISQYLVQGLLQHFHLYRYILTQNQPKSIHEINRMVLFPIPSEPLTSFLTADQLEAKRIAAEVERERIEAERVRKEREVEEREEEERRKREEEEAQRRAAPVLTQDHLVSVSEYLQFHLDRDLHEKKSELTAKMKVLEMRLAEVLEEKRAQEEVSARGTLKKKSTARSGARN